MNFVLDLEYLLTIKLYMAHIGLVAQYIYYNNIIEGDNELSRTLKNFFHGYSS